MTTDRERVSTTVAVPQIAVADLAVEQNLSTVRDRVTALDPSVEIAVFPEYALTGFVADDRAREVALDRDGPEIAGVQELAETAGVGLVVGFLERGSDETDRPPLYNALAYLDPDGSRTVYRKRHLWAAEASVLSRGDELVSVETPVGTAGLLTCYDLNFVADSAAFTRREVEALLVGAAWPAAHSENWRLLLRARALDGVRWVVGACRTGRRRLPEADSTVYAGRSAVVRPDGTVAASLGRGERDLVFDLDPAVLASQRDAIPIYDERDGKGYGEE